MATNNRKMKRILICTGIIISTVHLYAGKHDNFEIKFTDYTPPPELSNLLISVNQSIRKGELVAAAGQIKRIMDVKGQSIQKELDTAVTTNGPLRLALHADRIKILTRAYYSRNHEVARECTELLKKYSDQAKGKGWWAYISIYNHLGQYHKATGDQNKHLEVMKELYAYDQGKTIYNYLSVLLYRHEKPEVIRKEFDQYVKSGGVIEAGIGKLHCELIRREGGDALSACIKYLDEYPDQPPAWIKQILDIARGTLDVDKPENVRRYYDWMSTLAIKQPSDDKYLGVITSILNEKRKLETLVPEIVNKKRIMAITDNKADRK